MRFRINFSGKSRNYTDEEINIGIISWLRNKRRRDVTNRTLQN